MKVVYHPKFTEVYASDLAEIRGESMQRKTIRSFRGRLQSFSLGQERAFALAGAWNKAERHKNIEGRHMAQKRTPGDWISVGIFAVALFFLLAVLIVPRFAGPILVLFVIFLVVLALFAVTFMLMPRPAQKERMPLKEDSTGGHEKEAL